jgi:hypothetical protein
MKNDLGELYILEKKPYPRYCKNSCRFTAVFSVE